MDFWKCANSRNNFHTWSLSLRLFRLRSRSQGYTVPEILQASLHMSFWKHFTYSSSHKFQSFFQCFAFSNLWPHMHCKSLTLVLLRKLFEHNLHHSLWESRFPNNQFSPNRRVWNPWKWIGKSTMVVDHKTIRWKRTSGKEPWFLQWLQDDAHLELLQHHCTIVILTSSTHAVSACCTYASKVMSQAISRPSAQHAAVDG